MSVDRAASSPGGRGLYRYAAFGMTFAVPFPCPFMQAAPAHAIHDVIVEEGPVPHRLDAPTLSGPDWEVESLRSLWRGGDEIGSFFVVTEGSALRLTWCRGPQLVAERVGRFFVGVIMLEILRRRRLLTLHAATIMCDGTGIAISGVSGAGKTTTVATLMKQAHRLLADDVTALILGPDARPQAVPGLVHMHLCEAAAKALGTDIRAYPRHSRKPHKAVIPVEMSTSSVPLKAMYFLSVHEGDDLRVRPLRGGEKLHYLYGAMCPPVLAEQQMSMLALVTAVLTQVSMFAIERPARRWTAAEVAHVLAPRTRGGP